MAWWLPDEPGQFLQLAGWLTASVFVLRRRRRAAVVAAAATLTGQLLLRSAFGIGRLWWLDAVRTPGEIFLGTLALAALARSPGPACGLAILGRRRTWLIAAGLAVWGAAHQLAVVWLTTADVWFHTPAFFLVTRFTTLAAAAVGIPVGVVCLRSPVGRRVLVLAAPAVSPNWVLYLTERAYRFAGFTLTWALPSETVWVLYLTLASVVAAFAAAGRRRPGATGLASG